MGNVSSSKVNSKITFNDKHIAVHAICTVPYATSSLRLALLDTHQVKVKCTLVQAVGLGTGRTAHSGWAREPVWISAENLAPPPGFDRRTVQPVASRYTDCATRPIGYISSVWEIPVLQLTPVCTKVSLTNFTFVNVER